MNKTKLVVTGRGSPSEYSSEPREQARSCKYLGSMIESDTISRKEIKVMNPEAKERLNKNNV